MNYYNLKNEFKDYQGENGTFDLLSKEPLAFNSGYQVSFETEEDNYTEEQYNGIVKRLAKSYQVSLGKWENIVEISFHVEDLEKAIRLGKMFNQKAIWDFKHNTEIYL